MLHKSSTLHTRTSQSSNGEYTALKMSFPRVISFLVSFLCSIFSLVIMSRPTGWGHNALLAIVCRLSVCLSHVCPWVNNRRPQEADNWQEGSPWHGWPVTQFRGQKVKPLRGWENFGAAQLVCLTGMLMTTELLVCRNINVQWAISV